MDWIPNDDDVGGDEPHDRHTRDAQLNAHGGRPAADNSHDRYGHEENDDDDDDDEDYEDEHEENEEDEEEEDDPDYRDEPNEDEDEDEEFHDAFDEQADAEENAATLDDHMQYAFGDFRFQIVIEDEEAEQNENTMRLFSLLRAGQRSGLLTRQQLMTLFRGTGLAHQAADPKDPNRFPKVPSDEGRKLMGSGAFGVSETDLRADRKSVV